jgi:hypothetical protein
MQKWGKEAENILAGFYLQKKKNTSEFYVKEKK